MGTCHTGPSLPIPSVCPWVTPREGRDKLAQWVGGEPAPKGRGVGLCLSQHSLAQGLAQESKSSKRVQFGASTPPRSYPSATPLPGEERPQRDFPCSWQGHRRGTFTLA